jgi:hypothetical protein
MTIFNSYVKLPEGNRIMMYLLTPSWTTSMLWPLGWEESLTTGDCIHKHLQTVMFVVYDGHFNRENEFLNHWNWAKRPTSWCFLRWWYPHLEEPKIAEAHPFRACELEDCTKIIPGYTPGTHWNPIGHGSIGVPWPGQPQRCHPNGKPPSQAKRL